VSPDTAATGADTAVAIDVLANDTDIDGDPLSVAEIGTPGNGTAGPGPDGTVLYTPDPGFAGTDRFDYTVSDGQGGQATARVTVSVSEPANAPPRAVDDRFAGPAGGPVGGNVLANDSDPDGDTLAAAIAAPTPAGTATISATGDLFFAPLPGFSGEASVVYEVSDGNGGTDTATATLVVPESPEDGAPPEPANAPPEAADDAATTGEDTPVTIAVLANDTDADGDALSILSADASSALGGAVSVAGGAIAYDPAGATGALAAGETVEDSFSYTVSDGNGGSDTATVTVTVTGANDAPLAAPDAVNLESGDGFATASLLANDTDPDGDALSIPAGAGLALLSVETTGGPPPVAEPELALDPSGGVTVTRAPDEPVLFEGQSVVWTYGYEVTDGAATAQGTLAVRVTGDEINEFIEGGPEGDLLEGSDGRDTILGGDGGDTIQGGADDDELEGGTDGDVIEGGEGNDKLTGQAGDDLMLGQGGNDLMIGGAGGDTIVGGAGNDGLIGLEGSDVFVFGPGEGRNTIADFSPASRDGADPDTLRFEGVGAATPGQIAGSATPTEAGLLLLVGGTEVVLQNVLPSELSAADIEVA
jgi:VCBS repeat-containing protein